jgi:hypothetical protein
VGNNFGDFLRRTALILLSEPAVEYFRSEVKKRGQKDRKRELNAPAAACPKFSGGAASFQLAFVTALSTVCALVFYALAIVCSGAAFDDTNIFAACGEDVALSWHCCGEPKFLAAFFRKTVVDGVMVAFPASCKNERVRK